MNQPLELKAPGDERQFFAIPANTADLTRAYNGNVCSDDGNECQIKNNIIHLIDEAPGNITLAQNTNFWSVTARLYEETWRKRSIGLISGEEFSIEDEKKLLESWVRPLPGELIVDAGCSTALYARAILTREPSARVVALDFSLQMLEEARKRSMQEGHNIFLLRADASAMPFYAESVDAVVCGGSLNEFNNPEKVLYEIRRILKKTGRCFMMHLLEANTWAGRILQAGSKTGGLHFWSEPESDRLFGKAGLSVARRHKTGIVCFSLLHPV